jgi:hypothetical protein
VVARVNGQPISRARLEAALRRAPPGTTPAQALRALLDLEVLTQAAVAAGLDARPEARDLRDNAALQRMLEQDIEQPISLAAIPPDLPRQAYDNFSLDLFEPELATTSHILIELPEAAQSPARLAAAVAAAQALRAHLLSAAPSPTALTATDLNRAAALHNLLGWTTRAEHNITFPPKPIPPLPGAMPRFPSVVQPFADATARLTPQQPLSEPTVTSFGVHLILLTERRPDLRPAFEVARADIAQKLILAQRRITAKRNVDALAEGADIRLNDEPLEALAQRLFGTSTPAPEGGSTP